MGDSNSMSNLYLRGQNWHARTSIKGKEFRQSLGTKDRQEAEARLRKFLDRYDKLRPLSERAVAAATNPKLVYFIGVENGPIKIGVAHDVARRFSQIRAANPYPIALLAIAPGGHMQEAHYHRTFKAHRIHYEWFARTPEILAEIDYLNARDAARKALDTAQKVVAVQRFASNDEEAS